jgi:hypothetical protein
LVPHAVQRRTSYSFLSRPRREDVLSIAGLSPTIVLIKPGVPTTLVCFLRAEVPADVCGSSVSSVGTPLCLLRLLTSMLGPFGM